MATYHDLVKDLRALVPVPDSGPSGVADKAVARMVYRGAVRLVTDIADLNADDPRLPRSTSALTVPADLTSGITLPSGAVKLAFFEIAYNQENVRALVTIVPASQRYDFVHPTPAAYIAGSKLYPIAADGDTVVTDEVLEAADWADISTLTCEYVPAPTAPSALSTTFDLSLAFEQPSVIAGAIMLARGHAPELVASLAASYEMELNELRSTLAHGTRSTVSRVQGW